MGKGASWIKAWLEWRAVFWDRMTIYAPIVLMGLMALATWWLVRITPGAPELEPEHVLVHEPDYTMDQFSVQTFDAQGRLKLHLMGESAQHYPDNDQLEIERLSIRGQKEQSLMANAQSDRAFYDKQRERLRLLGQVQIERRGRAAAANGSAPLQEQDMSLSGNEFEVFLNEEQILSHQAMQLTLGRNRIQAQRFFWDQKNKVAEFTGQVRASWSLPADSGLATRRANPRAP